MTLSNSDVGRRACGIARELARVDAGERSAARRMSPGAAAPVFWRLASRYDILPHEEEKWLRITKAIALLTPASATTSIHEKDRRLGTILADGGQPNVNLDQPIFSEQRLARLLAARGPARWGAIERAVRSIARHTTRIDVRSLAWAFLSTNDRSIARDYYWRLDQHSKTMNKEHDNA